jgi:hypothetical protein
MNAVVRNLALSTAMLLAIAASAQAQARLTIVNQSQRDLSVKVMKAGESEDALYGRMTIPPMANRTMTFSETGVYFTKTMATLAGRDPIYQKGQPFQVYVGRDGYSVLTLTLTIVEAAVPTLSNGRPISRDEFEKDITRRP